MKKGIGVGLMMLQQDELQTRRRNWEVAVEKNNGGRGSQ
jgi:hypothetical protein